MLKRAFSAVLVSILVISSNSFASQADRAYQSAEQARSRLEKSQKLMRSRHNWFNVINRYGSFVEKYRKNARVDDALMAMGGLYTGLHGVSKKSEDINAAIEAYSTLVKRFPKSPLADDAVFKNGEIYLRQKGNREAAYIEFDKVVRKYPKGDMYEKAAEMLKELSAEAENHENTPSADITEQNRKTARVNDIKYWSNPDYTRVVVYADNRVSFKETFKREKEGDRPPRLFLDISSSRIGQDMTKPITINDGLLKMVRTGQFNKDTVRVVLDIESIDSYKIFALEDPYRIVIDVSGEKHEARSADQIENIISKTDETFSTLSAVPSIAAKEEPKPSLARQFGLGIKRVVVDPGHGGHDAGAVGYGGIREKDVVLDIGKKLRDILTERLGVEVVMTRDTDIFIPLEERTAIANKAGADLFISVHANASRNRKAGGLETYFLNFATDEDSMRLAATENATTTKNISDLQAILNDLMLNSKINESSKLARLVQDSMLDAVNGNGPRSKNRGVKQAPFYVLIGAQMPCILVETSFITNKEEAKRLVSDKFQTTIAESIANGVKEYAEVIRVARR